METYKLIVHTIQIWKRILIVHTIRMETYKLIVHTIRYGNV